MKLAIALLALMVASHARAEYDLKLSLAMLPATGFAQLALHEGAHAAIPALRGHPTQIRLFPGGGRIAETIMDRRDSTLMVSALPMLLDLAIIAVLPLVMQNIDSPLISSFFHAWRIAAACDLVWNLSGVFRGPETDVSRLSSRVGLETGATKILGVAAMATTIAFVAFTF